MQKNASPLYLTTFEKVGFVLLYQSQNKIPPLAYRLGRDDRLWHLKSHTLPKATSQSLRIQLTLNSDTDCRFQIRKHSIGGSRGTPLVGVRLLRKENAPHF